MNTFKFKFNKKLAIIVGISAVLLIVLGFIAIRIYDKNRPFTKAEYIKEVVIQKRDFDSILDKYLDQVSSYNGTKSATNKLIKTSNDISTFVENLEKSLKPKVPTESLEHFQKMMDAYKLYIEAVSAYKDAVPQNLGDERNELMNQAKEKLNNAEYAMKNFVVSQDSQ